ncbi:MerR family transcriptional regulator [Planktotalea sp.]|uniref:MerR family transcriptional regulator n=1 Tax=Planktotalea sp. TaxID=2029877 RepID=UPI003D6C3F34
MPKLFEDGRTYVLGDSELDLIGNREKLAQWRQKKMGPAYYKLGRKFIYHGHDLNTWAGAARIDPKSEADA